MTKRTARDLKDARKVGRHSMFVSASGFSFTLIVILCVLQGSSHSGKSAAVSSSLNPDEPSWPSSEQPASVPVFDPEPEKPAYCISGHELDGVCYRSTHDCTPWNCCETGAVPWQGHCYSYRIVTVTLRQNQCSFAAAGDCYLSKRRITPKCVDQSKACCTRLGGTYHDHLCYHNAIIY